MLGQSHCIGWVWSLERERDLAARPFRGAVGLHMRFLHHQRNCFRASMLAQQGPLPAGYYLAQWRAAYLLRAHQQSAGFAGRPLEPPAINPVKAPFIGLSGELSRH
ncbi:MAG: hypothetical protein AAF936_01055 [Pseudomonadota bacterium]